MREHINYEVFVRMMNRWTDEDTKRLAVAKAKHMLESCPFVDAVRGAVRDTVRDIDEVDPHLRAVAASWRRDLHWSDIGRYVTKGPRGSATQTLRVDGVRGGSAYVVTDEVSGEIEAT